MDSCTVPVAELLRRITEISDDGCTHVTVSFQLTNGSRGFRLPSAVFCAPLLKGTRIEKSLSYRQQRV